MVGIIKKGVMELATIIIVAMVGFAMGLYLSTQLSDWIDKNTKK